jgi:hypothetical protein
VLGELAYADHFVVEFLAGQLEAQAQVEVLWSVLALIPGRHETLVAPPERFRVQLLKREPAVPAALVIGGDAQPLEEAVPQIALVIRIERGHDETDELVAVVYEARPDLLRRGDVILQG